MIEEANELPYDPFPGELKCIQIGLLCIQEKSEDRPTMHDVLLMLANESIMIPQPKQPGFCYDSRAHSVASEALISNDLTITMLHGR